MNDMTLLFERFGPLFELSREMERLLASGDMAVRSFVPPADVMVTDDDVTVVMDVPGFKASDIDVELLDDVLTVRGERAYPYGDATQDGRTWQRLERGFGKFERSLRVPKGLDPDAIEASLSDGVLTLRIPMPDARKPHRIEIAAGEATADAQPTIESSAAGEGSTAETPAGERELVGAAA